MFISIDGGDGCGKSTQLVLLADWLRGHGRDVLTCRDPGSTPLGEEVRELLLNRHDLRIDRRAEMLLYMAARAQLADQVIRPALEAGRDVVADRYVLANVAYQGYGGGLDVPMLWEVGHVATGGLLPDLTVVLDVPPEVAAARLQGEKDRMELQGDAFHARVRQGFLDEAARHGERMVLLDASGSLEQVQSAIRRAVEQRMANDP